jgi:phosphate acyltransferase
MQRLRQQVQIRRRTRALKPATIALDAMGTDVGPHELLLGAYNAVTEMTTLRVIVTGPADHLRAIMRENGWSHYRLSVEDAPEVVSMHEAPRDSLRKRNSSVSVAARLVHQGKAQGMVSAGNTGATMATTMLQWRTLPGISRPAIVAIFPHPRHPCFLLDVGANVDCKPRHLLHFAIMGSVYARYVHQRRNPRIGVLSIGEEESKGNDLVYQAQQLLRASTLNYRGNAEGRDLLNGTFDVVVCDGFVGNTILKFGEGLVSFIFKNIKEELSRTIVSQLGALAVMPAFKNLKKQVDYAEYGGAPLLGLHGTCVICHGSSRAKAIKNAIRFATEMVSAKVNDHIVDLARQNSEITVGAAK